MERSISEGFVREGNEFCEIGRKNQWVLGGKDLFGR